MVPMVVCTENHVVLEYLLGAYQLYTIPVVPLVHVCVHAYVLVNERYTHVYVHVYVPWYQVPWYVRTYTCTYSHWLASWYTVVP
jgi:hypothetical protein